jgi:hypothetical protein
MKARHLLPWITVATTIVSVVAAGVLATAPSGTAMAAASPRAVDPLPLHLRDTGLYRPGPGLELQPQVMAFTPQYTLWSDGADKRRWIALPPGQRIDARQPDAWAVPGRHAAVEGVFARRPARRDTLPRAPGRRPLALRGLRVERRRQRRHAGPGGRRDRVARGAGAPGGRYDVPSQ